MGGKKPRGRPKKGKQTRSKRGGKKEKKEEPDPKEEEVLEAGGEEEAAAEGKEAAPGENDEVHIEDPAKDEMEKEDVQEEEEIKPAGGKKGRGKGRKIKNIVVIEDEEEEEEIPKEQEKEEQEEEEEIEEEEAEGDDEDVWEAVVWDDIGPGQGPGPVFDDESYQDIMREVVDQAWNDGVITEDEMAMLRVLKERLDIDDETFDRIISAGGYVSVNTGQAPEANAIPVPRKKAELAMD
ncbi:MAG: hypothetical protein ACMUHY_08655, partial [Thermoplasmatota archaeon]